MHPWQWLGKRDRDFAALRRAGRTAIVMPAMFALGDKVIGDAVLATFAAFGSFAMLLLVDFSGPMRERLQAQAALAVVGGVFVCLGTLASQAVWLAAAAMAVVGFGVIFAGVVSSVLAGATTSLLLAFILPVSLAGPVSSVPVRLAGWAMAAGASFAAVALLWPTPAHDRLRAAAIAACRALGARLRSEVTYLLTAEENQSAVDHDHAVRQASEAVSALRRAFLATPYRPTGLSTAARTIVRLVDEVTWLDTIVVEAAQRADGAVVNQAACSVKLAAAAALERGADLLELTGGNSDGVHAALAELTDARNRMERNATADLPVRRTTAGPGPAEPGPAERGQAASGQAGAPAPVSEFITSLDPSFRTQELSFAVSLIVGNIDLTAAAERRSWRARLLGRQPEGLPGRLSAAQERATAHVERHSVWLHNSVRAGAALGLAVLVAQLTGVEHSFWVVLGTLSVLRSNALNTGQNVVRGLAGTVAGFIIGWALLVVIGTNETLLWFLLPLAILLAGVAPAAISFAAGQAAFTVTLVILFNIIQPAGWRIGLLRVEDVALGCAVSLVVGLLFWPRGAGASLRQALAEAYTDSARYLAGAVNYGMLRYDAGQPSPATRAGDAIDAAAPDGGAIGVAVPTGDAIRAAAAARRLDDTYRTYLAERGAKPMPLADVTRLVTGVAGLRLAADAVLDLWQRDDGEPSGDSATARREIQQSTERVQTWYDSFAGSLINRREPPEPLTHDKAADSRLVEAVRHDLRGSDGEVSGTAVRMIWTADHLDAARRLQMVVITPARAAAELQLDDPLASLLPPRLRRLLG
jgi:uncharacterized membrane protein YccC